MFLLLRAKQWILFSPSNFFAPFFHVAGLLVPVLCGSQPMLVRSIFLFCEVCVVFFLVLPLLQDLCASGLRCLVPALAAQFVQSQQPLVVECASAVTVYPLVPYPHTYIALYSRTPKLSVTHTHTHKNKISLFDRHEQFSGVERLRIFQFTP